MSYAETLEAFGIPQRCDWCGATNKHMTMQRHRSGRILNLCFHGCQFFPEPYKATELDDDWHRVDPFKSPSRRIPRYGGEHGTWKKGREDYDGWDH